MIQVLQNRSGIYATADKQQIKRDCNAQTKEFFQEWNLNPQLKTKKFGKVALSKAVTTQTGAILVPKMKATKKPKRQTMKTRGLEEWTEAQLRRGTKAPKSQVKAEHKELEANIAKADIKENKAKSKMKLTHYGYVSAKTLENIFVPQFKAES